MKELLNEVQASVFMEYGRASEKFGKANNSPHESYAVILEEFEEAKNEVNMFEYNLRSFWNAIKAYTATKCQLQQMRAIAEKAAAEWIQVAAMCYKATIEKEDYTPSIKKEREQNESTGNHGKPVSNA
jgi:hypothetical protein